MTQDALWRHHLADYLAIEAAAAQEQSASPFDAMPHIRRLLYHRRSLRLAKRIQEAIWTVERFARVKTNVSAERHAPAKPSSAGLTAVSVKLPRIFLDVTATAAGRVAGGIAVVAEALARHGRATGALVPVVVCEDHIVLHGDVLAHAPTPSAGDVLLVIDHYWEAFRDYGALLANLRSSGVSIATCIHDLIPLEYPSLLMQSWGLPQRMGEWLPVAVAGSDVILSVSRSSAEDVGRYLETYGIPFAGRLTHFHNGYEPTALRDARPSVEIANVFTGDDPVFLSVGSLLPHKGHLIAIRALERLWADGREYRYAIVGPPRPGWPMESWIRRHPQYGRRLFRIDDASDADVQWLYRAARCLLQPSLAEGFGLPLIEAGAAGLPIIASDIPVFRELGMDSLVYFRPCDAADLAGKIDDFARGKTQAAKGDRQRTVGITWPQSLEQLRAALLDHEFQVLTAK